MKMNFRNIQLLLTLFGLLGIVSLFLPFAFDVSPVMAVHDPGSWRVGAPAFLAFLISYASMRLIVSGLFSKAEKAIAYIVSIASAGVTISFTYSLILENWPLPNFWTIITCIVPLAVLLSGTWLVISRLKQNVSREYCPLIALEVVSLANVLLCLTMFCPVSGNTFTEWQIGAWVYLATCVVYLLQIYLFATKKEEFPGRS